MSVKNSNNSESADNVSIMKKILVDISWYLIFCIVDISHFVANFGSILNAFRGYRFFVKLEILNLKDYLNYLRV